MLELQAVLILCRLWQPQGKIEAARCRLADIYHWFSEGFNTRDLIEAGTFLDSLAENAVGDVLRVI